MKPLPDENSKKTFNAKPKTYRYSPPEGNVAKKSNVACLHPRPEMLRDGGMIVQMEFNCAIRDVIFDYSYVLEMMPALTDSIPPELPIHSPEYINALRTAFDEWYQNRPLNTMNDIVCEMRRELNLSVPQFGAKLGFDGAVSGVYCWEKGSKPVHLEKYIKGIVALLKKMGNDELLEKARQVAAREFMERVGLDG